MGVNQMTGTPWHAERMHRSENNKRRYKGRCAFYSYDKNYCTRYCEKCRGSAHCMQYKAISDEEFKARQQEIQRVKRNTPKEDDDVYWY